MATASDGPTISEALLCEVAGINRATRRVWAKRGLLRRNAAGYTERDAIELAALSAISARLTPTDTVIVWSQIRPGLETTAPTRALDLVFDAQHKAASLCTDPGTVGPTVRHGRPVRVIAIGEAIEDVRDAFRRIVTAIAPAHDQAP